MPLSILQYVTVQPATDATDHDRCRSRTLARADINTAWPFPKVARCSVEAFQRTERTSPTTPLSCVPYTVVCRLIRRPTNAWTSDHQQACSVLACLRARRLRTQWPKACRNLCSAQFQPWQHFGPPRVHDWNVLRFTDPSRWLPRPRLVLSPAALISDNTVAPLSSDEMRRASLCYLDPPRGTPSGSVDCGSRIVRMDGSSGSLYAQTWSKLLSRLSIVGLVLSKANETPQRQHVSIPR